MKKVSYLLAVIVLTIGCWLVTILLWGSRSFGALIIRVIVGWLFVLALLLVVRRVSHRVWIYAGFLVLAGLFFPASMVVKIFPARLALPFETSMALTLLLIISAALVVAALLLYSGLNLHKKWQYAGLEQDEVSPAERKHSGRTSVVIFVLGTLLLAKAIHSFYWFMVWDTTIDPLGYLWLAIPFLAVLLSSVLLFVSLPGRTKLAGLLYLLLIPALIAVSTLAQRVNFVRLTEARAERATRAIETYYTREGRYPQDLRQLTPWTVLSLPGPVIIYGQGWCYDGGEDYYRLGYVYREHWSDPRLRGRLYKMKGGAADLDPICDEQIAALRNRYPQYFLMAGESGKEGDTHV